MKRLLALLVCGLAFLTPYTAQSQTDRCTFYDTEASIFFMSESIELTSQAEAVANQIIDNVTSNPDCIVDTLTIKGYADPKESQTLDPALSVVRAVTVGNILLQRGVTTDRVTLSGYGISDMAEGDTTPNVMRRRVDIKVTMQAK